MPSSTPRCICIATVFYATAIAALAAAADPIPEPVCREIDAREKKVEGIRYRWTSKLIRHPAGASKRNIDGPPIAIPGWGERDVVVEDTVCSLTLAPKQVRYAVKGLQLSYAEGKIMPWDSTFVISDGLGRSLYTHGQLRGRISTRDAEEVSVVWSPPAYAFRLFDPVIGIGPPENLSVVGSGTHGGEPCLILEWRRAPGPKQLGAIGRRWWLAKNLGYQVVMSRFFEKDGSVPWQMEIEYAKHPEMGWQVKSWRTAYLNKGVIFQSRISTVIEATLNPPIAKKTFELPFPVGTRVNDQRIGERYVVGQAPEVDPVNMLNDKNLDDLVAKVRDETDAQRNAPVDKETPPNHEPPTYDESNRAWPWSLVVASVAVALGVLAIIHRRRTDREQYTPGKGHETQG